MCVTFTWKASVPTHGQLIPIRRIFRAGLSPAVLSRLLDISPGISGPQPVLSGIQDNLVGPPPCIGYSQFCLEQKPGPIHSMPCPLLYIVTPFPVHLFLLSLFLLSVY